eukprot:NODE_251_length_11743_cov_0.676788.p8 type:complete len:106 gc:universal NODE_251_length_11743_cov_0.676788:3302-2985(-)
MIIITIVSFVSGSLSLIFLHSLFDFKYRFSINVKQSQIGFPNKKDCYFGLLSMDILLSYRKYKRLKNCAVCYYICRYSCVMRLHYLKDLDIWRVRELVHHKLRII